MAERTGRHDPLDGWDGSFRAVRRRQMLAGLAATPAQRLAWLEEMIALAHRSGALPRPSRRLLPFELPRTGTEG